MQFTLSSLLAATVLVALSVAVFGPWGIFVGAMLLGIVTYIRSAKSRWEALAKCVLAFLCVSCLFNPLIPVRSRAREAASRSQCLNNLKQIGLGLLNYQDMYGGLPPVRHRDGQGQPLYSWRVLLLPFVEQGRLFQQYDCREPWNGPNNGKLAGVRLDIYRCPSDQGGPQGMTNYVAVLGPDGNWLQADDREKEASNPVRIIERCDVQIGWAEPREVSLDEICSSSPSQPAAISSKHSVDGEFFYHAEEVGANALFADGRVRLIPPGVPEEVFRAALLGDRTQQDKLATYGGRSLNWPNCAALASLIVCFVLMLAWPRRRAAIKDAEEDSEHGLQE